MLYLLVLLLCGGLLYHALSGHQDTAPVPGKIDRITGQAAKEMDDAIRLPLGKANGIRAQEEKRLRDLEQGLRKQGD